MVALTAMRAANRKLVIIFQLVFVRLVLEIPNFFVKLYHVIANVKANVGRVQV